MTRMCSPEGNGPFRSVATISHGLVGIAVMRSGSRISQLKE